MKAFLLLVTKQKYKSQCSRRMPPRSTLDSWRSIHALPGPESPTLRFLQLPAMQDSPGRLPRQLPSAFLSQPGKEQRMQFPGCHCPSALPAASGNPLHELITHCEKAIYPQAPEHRALSGWCPLGFWTLLLLIGCDVHLLCMPQNILPGSLFVDFHTCSQFYQFWSLGNPCGLRTLRDFKMSAD